MGDQSNHTSIEGSAISGQGISIGSNNSFTSSFEAQPGSTVPAEGAHVFMSYCRADQRAAVELCKSLESSGIATWRDQAELVGGQVWRDAIAAAIAGSSAMLVLITANSIERNWSGQYDEILFARDRRRDFEYPIVPVIVGAVEVPAIPVGPETTTFADLQWLSLDISDLTACTKQIVGALQQHRR